MINYNNLHASRNEASVQLKLTNNDRQTVCMSYAFNDNLNLPTSNFNSFMQDNMNTP